MEGPDQLTRAAFAGLSLGHGFEWGWIDDMGERDDPKAYVHIWRCTATGERDHSCVACDAWFLLASRCDWMPKKPVPT